MILAENDPTIFKTFSPIECFSHLQSSQPSSILVVTGCLLRTHTVTSTTQWYVRTYTNTNIAVAEPNFIQREYWCLCAQHTVEHTLSLCIVVRISFSYLCVIFCVSGLFHKRRMAHRTIEQRIEWKLKRRRRMENNMKLI